jgi:hypothetical protein
MLRCGSDGGGCCAKASHVRDDLPWYRSACDLHRVIFREIFLISSYDIELLSFLGTMSLIYWQPRDLLVLTQAGRCEIQVRPAPLLT